jgi:hypothetical protein
MLVATSEGIVCSLNLNPEGLEARLSTNSMQAPSDLHER